MDSTQAFAMGDYARSIGAEMMVFDWDKAAHLIKDLDAHIASAGLQRDWEWTGGEIYRDGAPVPQRETYTYLASLWAIPELSIDGKVYECYRMQSELPDWSANTYWPKSALAILNT